MVRLTGELQPALYSVAGVADPGPGEDDTKTLTTWPVFCSRGR